MHLKQLRAFVLTGVKTLSVPHLSHEEEFENRTSLIFECIDELAIDEEARSEVLDKLHDALSVYEEHYFELGAKFGARILMQLQA